MREKLLNSYHALPPPLRSVAATLRGAYLRSWRYGSATDRLRDEALARDHWSPSEWHTWREEKLSRILHRAATRVPFYRDHWAERRRHGDRSSWEVLRNWPLLEKETLRQSTSAFVADDRRPWRMFHDHTSGTSGKSLDLWLSRETVQAWYALFEARCRHWNGVSRHDRWAIIGGQLVTPARQDQPPFWVWNASLHQLYLSAYHLAPRHAAGYVGALHQYQVRYIVGYPSALHALAKEALIQQLRVPHLDFILANAEPVLDQQRRDIEEAFGCPLRETYGMAEIVAGASECGSGRMHLWPELGELEVIDDNGSVDKTSTGELICTGLLNVDMPLIRYRVGDRGTLGFRDLSCSCGRALPIFEGIEGRVDDVLYTTDGRIIGRLDPVFKSNLPIREAQIVQDALDLIRVRYVPVSGFSRTDAQSLIERIRDRMGPVKVVLEKVDSIPRTANGKFRAVICNLSNEDRKRSKPR